MSRPPVCARTAIAHQQAKARALPLYLHVDASSLLGARDAMTNRVLYERLHEETGYHSAQRLGVDCHIDLQAVREARLLDRQIIVQQFEFLRDPYTRGRAVPQRAVQNGIQAFQHLDRFLLAVEFH